MCYYVRVDVADGFGCVLVCGDELVVCMWTKGGFGCGCMTWGWRGCMYGGAFEREI